MRLGEKIRMAVEGRLTAIEDDGVESHGRRIHSLLGLYIADILRLEIEFREMQRLERAAIGVGDIRVAAREAVDQKRVCRVESVLPPFVLDRRVTLRLGREIRQVEIELWIVE